MEDTGEGLQQKETRKWAKGIRCEMGMAVSVSLMPTNILTGQILSRSKRLNGNYRTDSDAAFLGASLPKAGWKPFSKSPYLPFNNKRLPVNRSKHLFQKYIDSQLIFPINSPIWKKLWIKCFHLKSHRLKCWKSTSILWPQPHVILPSSFWEWEKAVCRKVTWNPHYLRSAISPFGSLNLFQCGVVVYNTHSYTHTHTQNFISDPGNNGFI